MKFLGNIIWLLFGGIITSVSDIQPNTNDNDHWYTFWPPDLKISDTGFMAFWQPCRRRGEFRRMLVTYHEHYLDIRRRLLDLPYASRIRPFAMYHDHRHPFRHATF